MPRYSVIVTITRDIVVNAPNEKVAMSIVRSKARDFTSADEPECSYPAEVADDYTSSTDDDLTDD